MSDKDTNNVVKNRKKGFSNPVLEASTVHVRAILKH
jgi:hypothetical protein